MRRLDNKGVSFLLVIIGVALMIVGFVLAFTLVDVAREQLSEGVTFDVYLGSGLIREAFALIFFIAGLVLTILGLKK